MILKIGRNEFKSGSTEEFESYSATFYKGWWIIGEIEKIHYSYMPKKEVPKYIEYSECYDLCIKHLTREKMLSSKALKMTITFSDTNKNPFNALLQDCVCYLCNEDGKTIDKLIC